MADTVKMRRRLLPVVVVVLAGLLGAFVIPHFFATSPTTTGTGTSTSGTATSVATTTTLPPQQITGVGEYTTTVTEPGVQMCPPGFPCRVRSYTLLVFYPSTDGTQTPRVGVPLARPASAYPLVVFGHGFDVDPSIYQILLNAWVMAGYVVAAPIYPLTAATSLASWGVNPNDNYSLGLAYENDLVNQPKDDSFAIDTMIQLASTPGSIFYENVDPSEIAVAGQSDGASTALLAGFNPCCDDSRIKVGMILSGSYVGSESNYFAVPAIPILVTQGSADSINDPSLSNQVYDNAGTPKYYLTLDGADHLEPYTQPTAFEAVVAKVTVDFLDAYLRGSASAAAAIQSDGNTAGVSSITSDLGG